MKTRTVLRIENEIAGLSLAEQLWLMERLARRIRRQAHQSSVDQEHDLECMARDPDIRRELGLLSAEFLGTEMDGLDERR